MAVAAVFALVLFTFPITTVGICHAFAVSTDLTLLAMAAVHGSSAPVVGVPAVDTQVLAGLGAAAGVVETDLACLTLTVFRTGPASLILVAHPVPASA